MNTVENMVHTIGRKVLSLWRRARLFLRVLVRTRLMTTRAFQRAARRVWS